MIDPNGLTEVQMICEQIDHSAWWVCFWLMIISTSIPSYLKIKKDS